MRAFSAPLHRISVIVLLITFSVFYLGCDSGGGINPNPPGASRTYGPPLYAISFVDAGGYLGTASPTPSTTPYYVKNIGTGTALLDPGYCALWSPSSSISGDITTAHFLTSDVSSGGLVVLDEQGVHDETISDGIPDFFTISFGGTYVAYVKESGNLQQFIVEGIGTNDTYVELSNLSSPKHFGSKPSFSFDVTKALISEFDDNTPSNSRTIIYNSSGAESYVLAGRVYGAQFDRNGTKVAYIDGANGAQAATRLVVTTSQLIESDSYDFSSYGTGACALGWSPNANMIALYAGVFSDEPRLIVYNLFSMNILDLTPSEGTIAVEPNDHPNWCYPAWSPSSDALAFMIKVGEDDYQVVSVDLDGNVDVLVDGLNGISRPDWLDNTN